MDMTMVACKNYTVLLKFCCDIIYRQIFCNIQCCDVDLAVILIFFHTVFLETYGNT